jgi:hypothetical protein
MLFRRVQQSAIFISSYGQNHNMAAESDSEP